LLFTDYTAMISPKILNQPTTKDFVNIFSFLAAQFDPNRKPNPDVQKEVLTTMNHLRYPFTVSKSALQSVGSPHTWPNLLAVLHWMVELLVYDAHAHVDTADFTNLSSDDSDKFFYDFLRRSYEAFLAGEDDDETQGAELEERFELRDESCAAEVDRLDEENANLRAEIELLQAAETGFQSAEGERDNLARDVRMFEKQIEQQVKHKAVMEQQLDEKQTDAEEVQAELEEAQREREECRQRVGEQVMSVGDVQRLQHDKVTMDDHLQRISDEKEAMDKELWETELAVKNALDEVEDGVRTYTKKAEELKIIPSSAKMADGVDFSLKFNRLAANVDDMLDKDLKRDIKSHLGDVKVKLVSKYHAVEDDKYAATEKLQAIANQITDHSDNIAAVSETLQRAENTLSQEKELWTEKKRGVTNEIDEVESRIHLLKAADESALSDSQRSLDDLGTEFQVTKQRFEAEKSAMNDALLSLTFELTDHREYIAKSLAMINTKAEEVLREVALEDTGEIADGS